MSNSTGRRRRRNHQAAKLRPDWPLTARPSGRWKKVRGVLHYFGRIGTGPDKREIDQAACIRRVQERRKGSEAGRGRRTPRRSTFPRSGSSSRCSARLETACAGMVDGTGFPGPGRHRAGLELVQVEKLLLADALLSAHGRTDVHSENLDKETTRRAEVGHALGRIAGAAREAASV